MNIWKKFMSLFNTTKEIETTEITVDEAMMLKPVKEVTVVEEKLPEPVAEVTIEEVKETKPKKRRYYPKKPKATSSEKNNGERPTSKPKRPKKD
jgi:hypothetical protein